MYVSKEIEFDAPAPFNDAEAIKVINGIVKTGDIPKGTKPNQFTSAADNYGYALGIMKKDGHEATQHERQRVRRRPRRMARDAGQPGQPKHLVWRRSARTSPASAGRTTRTTACLAG